MLVNRVERGRYLDSVALMRVSRRLEALAGVEAAALVIGSPSNKALLRGAGLLAEEGESATPNDLIIALKAADEHSAAQALESVDHLLAATQVSGKGGLALHARRLAGALELLPQANLALISVPGEFAAYEARKALERGLHVLLFSDNVPLEDEVALKTLAKDKNLLLMGPDCGTALIAGMPLPSPTPCRAATSASCRPPDRPAGSLVPDRAHGRGHLPWHRRRRARPRRAHRRPRHALRPRCARAGSGHHEDRAPLQAARAGGRAARAGTREGEHEALRGLLPRPRSGNSERVRAPLLPQPLPKPPSGQWARRSGPARSPVEQIDGKRVEGLYSGGTLCAEAELIFRRRELRGHRFVDLGDDEYTRGRPHP